jgi:hypothetical protein
VVAAFGLDRNQNSEITGSQVIVLKHQFLIKKTELIIDQIMLLLKINIEDLFSVGIVKSVSIEC